MNMLKPRLGVLTFYEVYAQKNTYHIFYADSQYIIGAKE